MPVPFTIKSWLTCQSGFDVFVSWIQKTCLTDAARTSLERRIIWSSGRPATVTRRCLADVPIYNISIFVFPVKDRNKYVIQRLLLVKYNFINKSFLYLLSESLLKVPCRSRTLDPLGDLQGTSPDCPVRAEWLRYALLFILETIISVGSS